MKTDSFMTQQRCAQKIKDEKSKEWIKIAQQYIPLGCAESLFHKSGSYLADMLKVDPERGYIYDPETLENGIDMLMIILTRNQTQGRIERIYSTFEDPITRITYLRFFIYQLELYPKLAKCMLDDFNEVMPAITDPEEIEVAHNIISMLESEMSKNDYYQNQPQ